ncbi:MAG: hypothetical protein J0I06_20400 [Planctomycetes bacterium]|nr:hypothetical protein [Planctomycetota bacterium]
MTRCAVPLALLAVLLAPAGADAGFGRPGTHIVPADYILTVDRDHPDHAFYLLGDVNAPPVRLPLAPSDPIRLFGGKQYGYRWAQVFAVRNALLAEFTGPPPREWLQAPRDGVVPFDRLDFRTTLPFTDTRDRVEITYRVEVGPDGARLVQVGENAGNPWVERGWIAAAVLASAAAIALGVWVVRRVRRSRSR